jgi:LysM repeat protein
VAAPLAFLLAATIGILLIRSALHAEDEPPPVTRAETQTEPATTAPATTAPPATTEETTTAVQATYHVVEAGDTLGSIADQYGTTVEALLELNPGIDPVALSIGQQIRVG